MAAKRSRPNAASGPKRGGPPGSDERRAELVQATYELIADRGLEELRTRDIAAKVGINIATLHYYFETKEELVAAVVDHITKLFQTVHAPMAENPTAVDQLRQLFDTQSHRRRVQPKLDTVVQEMMLRGRRDERVRARLEVMMLLWNGYVESIVARGIERGELSRHLDPKATAGVITSCMVGSNVQHGVRPTTFSVDETYASLLRWLLPTP